MKRVSQGVAPAGLDEKRSPGLDEKGSPARAASGRIARQQTNSAATRRATARRRLPLASPMWPNEAVMPRLYGIWRARCERARPAQAARRPSSTQVESRRTRARPAASSPCAAASRSQTMPNCVPDATSASASRSSAAIRAVVDGDPLPPDEQHRAGDGGGTAGRRNVENRSAHRSLPGRARPRAPPSPRRPRRICARRSA